MRGGSVARAHQMSETRPRDRRPLGRNVQRERQGVRPGCEIGVSRVSEVRLGERLPMGPVDMSQRRGRWALGLFGIRPGKRVPVECGHVQ